MESSHIDKTTIMSSTNTAATAVTAVTAAHKLKHKWNLWAHEPQDPDWNLKSYKKIIQFKTVEETITIAETLPADFVKSCMLFIMRDGVTPMWEDPKNRNGGCFSYKVPNKLVCEVWRDLTYALVGENVSANQDFINSVTGITISPKKLFCIIKIWTTGCAFQNPQIVTSEIKNLSPAGCLFKKHTPEF